MLPEPAAPFSEAGGRFAELLEPIEKMEENAEFGSNPGNLGMYSCVPRGLAKSSALVVALHGGQQTARDFDLATGWLALGRKHGFAVMFPEQKCANNSQNCFNWFIERHISSNDGEIASIRAMVEKMLRDHNLDRNRVFVTGLSAAAQWLARFSLLIPICSRPGQSSRASPMERRLDLSTR